MKPVAIRLDQESHEVLNENGIDLFDELRKAGLEIERPKSPPPEIPIESNARGVELIILCSAAAIAIAGPTIVKIIDRFSGKNSDCIIRTTKVARDADGVVVLDANGKPIYETSESIPVSSEEKNEVDGYLLNIKCSRKLG